VWGIDRKRKIGKKRNDESRERANKGERGGNLDESPAPLCLPAALCLSGLKYEKVMERERRARDSEKTLMLGGAVSCSMLQRVAVCRSVLQCVAVCCSVLQCVEMCVAV